MTLKNIYDYGGNPAKRHLTIADIIALKGKRKMTMTAADSPEEAAICEQVGIDVITVCDRDIVEIRDAAPHIFVTAQLAMTYYQTPDDILRAALTAVDAGADMLYTMRGFGVVEILVKEGMSVMGHVGLVPRRSTQIGGLRAVGKTADEAMLILEQCRRYEDAGACWVEFECVASEALKEISKHTSLITHSIGAGPSADIIFLFMEDICGDNPNQPRHARAFGDLLSIRKQLSEERFRAVSAYKSAVENGSYPGTSHSIVMPAPELEKLREVLDKL